MIDKTPILNIPPKVFGDKHFAAEFNKFRMFLLGLADQVNMRALGYTGYLQMSDSKPTVAGLYKLIEIGAYTNLTPAVDTNGNPSSIVSVDGKLNEAYYDGSVWIKSETDLPKAVPVSTLSPSNIVDPLNGKAVADYAPSKTQIGVKVYQIGENIIPALSNSDFNDTVTWGAGYFDNAGNIVASSSIHYTKLYYPVVPGAYTSNVQLATGVPMSFILYDSNKNFLSFIGNKPNTDWTFTVAQAGYIRGCKLNSQAAELDYIKTSQVYEGGLTDNVFITKTTADNTLLKTTDRAKIDRILQPKFFLNATRNVDYSAFSELWLTGGSESDLKDSSGNWLELYLVYIRVKELNGTTNTLIQIAKKNTTTGVVDVNNISVASGTTTNSIVDANGFLKLSLTPQGGSNLSFDIILNVSKLSLADDTNKGLTNTLQLNTHYLFETKKTISNAVSKTVVCLGDSITEFGNYPSDMATMNNWTVVNCGFGGCRMARHNMSNTAGQNYNEMGFFRVADTIASGNYTALDAAADYLATNQSDDNRPQVARLKAINWLLVDYIVVAYGTNDYAATTAAGSVPMGLNTDVMADGSTLKGAINYGVKRLLETYPHLQIIFVTPIYRRRYTAVDDGLNSDTYANDRGYLLRDYANAIIDICDLNHIENIDLNKMSGINKYTAATKFISSDGVHPTTEGYNLLAKRIGGKIKSMF